jgi:hypothetical protein
MEKLGKLCFNIEVIPDRPRRNDGNSMQYYTLATMCNLLPINNIG